MEVQEVERLIKISKDKPLLPETFVPWSILPLPEDEFLPEKLNSLSGLPFYDSLTPAQKKELGRHEVVQVMYSYGWSEGLFCLFMNRYILTLQPDNVEYKFLLRELIEEFRHQEMFAQAIAHLNGKPIKPTRLHNFFGSVYGKVYARRCRVYELLGRGDDGRFIRQPFAQRPPGVPGPEKSG
jgi:hypothetical protein